MEIRNHFIIAGAQRSGTTLLYHILKSHPDVFMAGPLRPEPKFFLKDEEYRSGYEYYIHKYFKDASDYRYLGEKSTSYMEYPFIPHRIKRLIPGALIIFILRNPVHRAISNYFFSLNNNLEKRTIEDVFLEEVPPPEIRSAISVSPFKYIDRGFYLKYLRPYFDTFSRKRIKILILEKLISGSDIELDSLLNFLNLQPDIDYLELTKTEINASQKDLADSDLDPVVNSLKEKYYKSILELESYLNIDLSVWRD